MVLLQHNQDITKTEADTILFCGEQDFSLQQQQDFKKQYPTIINERQKLYQLRDTDNNIVWTPGKIKLHKFSNIPNILHGCFYEQSECKAKYSNLHNLLSKIRDTYLDLGIRKLAVPPVGKGGGLVVNVVELFFRSRFDETVAEHTSDSLTVFLYL